MSFPSQRKLKRIEVIKRRPNIATKVNQGCDGKKWFEPFHAVMVFLAGRNKRGKNVKHCGRFGADDCCLFH